MLAAILLIHSVTAPGGVNLATQVGRPFDASLIAQDVRTLWSLGRFRDIRVESTECEGGADVIFHAFTEAQFAIREIRLKPNPLGIQFPLPSGARITRVNARDLAHTVRRQYQERGYWHATVDWEFVPAPRSRFDLVLSVKAGDALRLRASGDTSLHPPKVYSAAAVDGYTARLTSHYIALGYYDAQVTVTEQIRGNDAVVNFAVARGTFQHAIDTRALCTCLFRQRREAERRGILEFRATLDTDGVPATWHGQAYTVGRISFLGHPHFSDAAIRRNFVLDEGAPLDGRALRRSLDRLNRAGMFEPIDERRISIRDTARRGVADITIQLAERRRGAWNFSGPLPLSASVGARLPAWGQGALELSTYAVSFNLLAYSSILKLTTARRFLPVLALERPFTPGAGWLSGFALAPQVPKKVMGANYLFTQFDRRVQPLLAGQRDPDLTVTLQRPAGETALICEAPQPRLRTARVVAGIALHVVRSFAAF